MWRGDQVSGSKEGISAVGGRCSIIVVNTNIINDTVTHRLSHCGLDVTILRGGLSIYGRADNHGSTIIRNNFTGPVKDLGTGYYIRNGGVVNRLTRRLGFPFGHYNGILINGAPRSVRRLRHAVGRNTIGNYANLRVVSRTGLRRLIPTIINGFTV